MEAISESDPTDMKALRRQRYDEIKETETLLRELSSTEHIYFLLDPDQDVIRYVGVCVSPKGRFSNHLHSATRAKRSTPVSQWIRTLIDRGTLPRMWVVAEVTAHSWRYNSHVHCSYLARWLEKMLILRCCKGGYFGNGHLESRLLNVEHMPDIFLPNGIDAGKDRH